MFSRSLKQKTVDHLHLLRALLCTLLVLIGIQAVGFADPPQGTERKIVSDDFTKNRQEAAPIASNTKGSQGQASNGIPLKARPRRTYPLPSHPTIKASPPHSP